MSTSYGSDPMERRQGEERELRRDRTAAGPPHIEAPVVRPRVLAAQKARYGGIKAGSAFFGWLTATGIAVLLTAMVAAAGTAIAISNKTNVGQAAAQAAQNAKPSV